MSNELQQIDQLQTDLVELWHRQDPKLTQTDFMGLVEAQHLENFQLWHEEDKARSRTATDQEIANVKRNIDRFNQARNDLIEKLDEALLTQLADQGVSLPNQSNINSETPGSMIDRCSIMALRIFHMLEQVQRSDVDQAHRDLAEHKVQVLRLQRGDLLCCAQDLINEIIAGTRQFKIYRQFKMYNDPTLNPEVYGDSKGDK